MKSVGFKESIESLAWKRYRKGTEIETIVSFDKNKGSEESRKRNAVTERNEKETKLYTNLLQWKRRETPVMLELQIESQMQSEREEGLCEKHIPNDTDLKKDTVSSFL